MLISKIELHNNISIKVLLPKYLLLSDFSPTENLIEIEDTKEGERFWVEPKVFFKRDIQIGKEIFILENNMVSTAKVERFDGIIYRKRCYLLAFLKFFAEPPVPFDRNIHLPHSFRCREHTNKTNLKS